MPDTRSIYALILVSGVDMEAERALMAQARVLAEQRGGQAHVVVASPLKDVALEQARSAGIDHLWHIPATATLQTHQYVDLFCAALRAPGLAEGLHDALILVISNPDNETFAGALAARLGAAPLGRCTAFEFDSPTGLRVQRHAYGNRLDIALSAITGPAVAAIRPNASSAPCDGQTAVHTLNISDTRQPYSVTATPRAEPHAPLSGAQLVVSGGRGSGEAAFPMLYEIAARLNGAVGASLPAVDAGWAPVSRQIGISGTYVRPRVYLAIGISGTPQHLAGIDPHTHIVAVNKDAKASIFDVADVGVVAPWQEFLPALINALDPSAVP